jgi:hypothetical protein
MVLGMLPQFKREAVPAKKSDLAGYAVILAVIAVIIWIARRVI